MDQNFGPERVGEVRAGTQRLVVTQLSGCPARGFAGPSQITIPPEGTSFDLSISRAGTTPACRWTPFSAPFVTLQKSSPESESVRVTIGPNLVGERRALINALEIGGQVEVVQQTSCSITIDQNTIEAPASATTIIRNFTLSNPACQPSIIEASDFLRGSVLLPATGQIRIAITSNQGGPRSGVLIIGGAQPVVLRVNQADGGCTVQAIGPTVLELGAGADASLIRFSRPSGAVCTNVLRSSEAWLRTPGSIRSILTDSGLVFESLITALPNDSGQAREARLDLVNENAIPILTYTIRQRTNRCSPEFSVLEVSAAHTAGTTPVNLRSAPADCSTSFELSTTSDFITLPANRSATGPGNFIFPIGLSANLSALPRTAKVQAGATATSIVQRGCPVSVSTNPLPTVPAAGGTVSLGVVTTVPGCRWSASSASPELSILGQPNNSGPASLQLSVRPNAGGARSLGLTVGVQSLTLQQEAGNGPCVYTITPSLSNLPNGASNGAFTLSGSPANCTGEWTARASASFVSLLEVTSGRGAGPFSISYSVSANTTAEARTAAIQVGSASHSILQAAAPLPPCTFSIDPISRTYAPGASIGTIAVSGTPNPCGGTWTAATDSAFIRFRGEAKGTGSGPSLLNFDVLANPGDTTRTGVISVGTLRHTATQQGRPACIYRLIPGSFQLAGEASASTITVEGTPADCIGPWQITGNSDFVTFPGLRGGEGVGPFTIPFSATANNTGAERLASFTIGGRAVRISQAALPVSSCRYTATPGSLSFSANGSLASFVLTGTPSNCTGPWTATTNSDFINLSGPTSGNGPGPFTINFGYSANRTTAVRTAVITAGGFPVSIRQATAELPSCQFTLEAAQLEVGSLGSQASMILNAGPNPCNGRWEATTNATFVRLGSPSSGTGAGRFSIPLNVNANPSPTARNAEITVGGLVYRIQQAASTGGGRFTVTPDTINDSARITQATSITTITNWFQTLEVRTDGSLSTIQISTDNPFLRVSPATLSGSGSVRVFYDGTAIPPNPFRATITFRSATTTVAVPVTLAVLPAEAPSVLAQPAIVRFRWRAGDPAPPPQTVSVFTRPSALGMGQPANLPEWLTAKPDSLASPVNYTLAVNTSRIPADATSLSANVVFPTAANTEVNARVLVELQVERSTPPTLLVPRTEFTVNAAPNGPPVTLEVPIANTGGAPLTYRVTSASALLQTDATAAGSLRPGERAILRLAVLPGSTPSGSVANATFSVTPNPGTSVAVTVRVAVSPLASGLLVSRESLSIPGIQGRGIVQASFIIESVTGEPVPWVISVRQNQAPRSWLAVDPSRTEGIASPRSATSIFADPNGLPEGRYEGTVGVRANRPGSPEQLVLVRMDVVPLAPPNIEISPATASVVVFPGAGAEVRNFTLTSRTGRVVNYVASYAMESGQGWLSGPAGGSIAANGSATLTASIVAGNNPFGVYRGSIRLDFGSGVIQQVNVQLTVLNPANNPPRQLSSQRSSDCIPTRTIASFAGSELYDNPRAGNPVALTAVIRDDCGQPATASQFITRLASGATITLNRQSDGTYIGDWVPLGAAVQQADLQIPLDSSDDASLSQVVFFTAPARNDDPPAITSILNASSFTGSNRVTPGALISIFGQRLAAFEQSLSTSVPFTLGGTRVYLGDQILPLFYAGPGQVNVALPFDLVPGETYMLRLERDGVSAMPVRILVSEAEPGIFHVTIGGRDQAAALVAGTSFLAGPRSFGDVFRPVAPGGFLQIYASGMGAVTNPPTSGSLAGLPLSLSDSPITVLLDDEELTPVFAGLAPGFIGLYQINVQVPFDFVPNQDARLRLRVGNQLSNLVRVAVAP